MKGCDRKATFAALDCDLIEHAICDWHEVAPIWETTKPLKWSPTWGPVGA